MTSDIGIHRALDPLSYSGPDSPHGKFYEAVVVRVEVNGRTLFVPAFNWGPGAPSGFTRGQIGLGVAVTADEAATAEAERKWRSKVGKGYAVQWAARLSDDPFPSKLAVAVRTSIRDTVSPEPHSPPLAAPGGNDRLGDFRSRAAAVLSSTDEAQSLDLLASLKEDLTQWQQELEEATATTDTVRDIMRSRLG